MKPAEKARWRNKWNDRDVNEITKIARGLRARYPINDSQAWEAAERAYVEECRVSRGKSKLYARLQ